MKDNELIKKTLSELKKIRKENIFDNNINREIDESMNKINNIMEGNKIKIAILGEFSSGKSTFINALLKDNLLSYADEPTTANNTYVTYGEKQKIIVNFNNGSKKLINENQIEKYTKEGIKKDGISNVIIEIPNEFLKKGIVIIDTPGANIDNKSHNEQRNIAIEESSIAIFVISVNSLTSKSFIEFLKINKNKLSKFIFIISKCDKLEDDGIDIEIYKGDKIKEVVEYVKRCIEKFGELKNPSIYPISAYKYLNNQKSSIIDVKRSFNNLINDIEKMYEKEKKYLILFEIYKILEKISKTINTMLNNKHILCELEIKKVNGEIESFERFIFNNYKDLLGSIDNEILESKKDIKKEIDKNKIKAMEKLQADLNKINSLASLKSSMNNISEGVMKSYISSCENIIKLKINNIGIRKFKKIEYDFKIYFKNLSRTYKELGIDFRIRFKTFIKKILITILSFIISYCILQICRKFDFEIKMIGIYWSLIPFVVSVIIFLISLFDEKEEVSYHIPYESKIPTINFSISSTEKNINNEMTETHGLGAGVIIGAMAGGPLGALIGGTVGGILSGILLKDRINELKSEYKTEMNNELNRIENKFNLEIDNLLGKRKDSIIKEYKNYVGENMGLYKQLLDGIYNYYNNKFLSLRSKDDKLKHYLNVFNQISDDIIEEKSKIQNR